MSGLSNRNVQLEDASAEHFAFIAEVYNQNIGITTLDLKLKTAADIVAVKEALHPRERLYIALAEKEPIGFCRISLYHTKEGYRHACETSVFLEQSFTAKGYGPKIKRLLMQRCYDLGYRHLVARIMADNKASIEYNLKLGYKMVGTQHRIGRIKGEWCDVVVLECNF